MFTVDSFSGEIIESDLINKIYFFWYMSDTVRSFDFNESDSDGDFVVSQIKILLKKYGLNQDTEGIVALLHGTMVPSTFNKMHLNYHVIRNFCNDEH